MNTPLCTEIAENWELWQDYVGSDATMTEAEFDEMTMDECLAIIHESFPDDCNCEPKPE